MSSAHVLQNNKRRQLHMSHTLNLRSPGSNGVMIGRVDDRKLPAKVDAGAESSAAVLPAAACASAVGANPTRDGGPDVALTYCEVVRTKRLRKADPRKFSLPVAPTKAEARAIARRDAAEAAATAAAAAAAEEGKKRLAEDSAVKALHAKKKRERLPRRSVPTDWREEDDLASVQLRVARSRARAAARARAPRRPFRQWLSLDELFFMTIQRADNVTLSGPEAVSGASARCSSARARRGFSRATPRLLSLVVPLPSRPRLTSAPASDPRARLSSPARP